MSVVDSLLVGAFGMAVVFIVLLGLSQLLRLQSALINRFSRKKSESSGWDEIESEVSSLNSVMQTPYTEVLDNESEVIVSPGVGTVLKVQTSVGEQVKIGDVLLLFVAMNMEYEIEATRDGIVTQILTSEGASVDCGTPLIEIQ